MIKQDNNTPVLVEHQFNGKAVCLREEDGYVSATAMCKAAGKLIGHYKSNDQTKDYLEALSADIGIPISALIQTLRGGNSKNTQGTWVHPKVAIHLAQWLSPQFAVQVTNWVYDWMNDQVVALPSQVAPSSVTPVALHGCVVLVIHADGGDWVSVRSLCEVTALDYKWTCRSAVASGIEMSSVAMSGEQIPCFSVAGAIVWLRGIHLDKIQLKKRNRVMTAILQLPDLLLAACEAEAVPALPDGTRNHTWVVTNSSGREIERVAVSDAAALGKQVGRYFPEQVTLDREAVIGRLDSAVHIMMGASAKLSHELMPLIQTLGTAPDCDDEGVKQFWEKRVAAAGDRLSRVAEGGVA